MGCKKYFSTLFILLSAVICHAGGFHNGMFVCDDLVQSLHRGQTVSFFVELIDQADTSDARYLSTKEEKGWYVYNTLTEHARRTQADLIRLLDRENIKYRSFWISNVILVEGDMHLFEMLVVRDDIQALYPNLMQKVLPDMPEPDEPIRGWGPEWNLYQVKAVDVWTALNITGRNIVIMNNDTGVEWTHSALRDNYRGWDGVIADHQYNWFDATGTYPLAPGDGHNHGTWTNGITVGNEGSWDFTGVAIGAEWIAFKCMDDNGSGESAWLLASFQWALAPTRLDGTNPDPSKSPHVINNSWGGSSSTPFLETPIQNCVNAGIFVVFAVGNQGPDCSSLRINGPANYTNVCAVGSVDSDRLIAAHSNRGPSNMDPNVIKPNVVAPGVDIRSSIPGNSFHAYSGTSAACPHVAGLVALLWEANPSLIGDVDYTRWIIRNTAFPTYDDQCGSGHRPNNVYGMGEIDCLLAVCVAMNIPTPTPSPTPVHSPTPTHTWTPVHSPTPTPTPMILYVPSQYDTIQAAVDAATNGSTVMVEDGIYSGMGNHNINLQGKAITVRSVNGPENCIIDTENWHGRKAFLCYSGTTRDTIIHGFTIRNVRHVSGPGGAISVSNGGQPVISGCVFTGNSADKGASIHVSSG